MGGSWGSFVDWAALEDGLGSYASSVAIVAFVDATFGLTVHFGFQSKGSPG